MPDKDEFLRKREQRQKQIRKRKIKATVITILILSVVAAVVLCLTVLFPIKSASASGSNLYEGNEIVKSSSLLGSNLFMINSEKTASKIRKSLPYIDKVEIKRELPDTVCIKVYDASDYAYYTRDGKFYKVSKKGYVLSEETEEPKNLTKIICSKVECSLGEKAKVISSREKEIIKTLIDSLKEKEILINSIDVSNKVAINVRVLDRFDVNFGTSANLDKKIDHLNGMIKSIGEERKGNIDLSMWTPQKSEGSFTAKAE